MPYKIISSSPSCFRVQDVKNPQEKYSTKCQTKKMAQKQRIAIVLSEHKGKKGSLKSYFL